MIYAVWNTMHFWAVIFLRLLPHYPLHVKCMFMMECFVAFREAWRL